MVTQPQPLQEVEVLLRPLLAVGAAEPYEVLSGDLLVAIDLQHAAVSVLHANGLAQVLQEGEPARRLNLISHFFAIITGLAVAIAGSFRRV